MFSRPIVYFPFLFVFKEIVVPANLLFTLTWSLGVLVPMGIRLTLWIMTALNDKDLNA